MDGGRVQSRQKNGPDGSRWRENKVLTLSSFLPGDGKDQPPQRLVTTYLATMRDSDGFGVWARLEAERRGIRQARQVLVLADGGAWIDTLHQRHFPRHIRIIDWYHAVEHLHEVAQALYPQQEQRGKKLAARLETLLWQGRVAGVLRILRAASDKLGPPLADDDAEHPRRVLAQNVGYFARHAPHMNYPEYRRRGWPVGSGITEGGVKSVLVFILLVYVRKPPRK